MARLAADATARAVELVRKVCDIAGDKKLIDDDKDRLKRLGVIDSRGRMAENPTPKIFDFLVDLFKYQGVSDNIADKYVENHGQVHWSDIANALAAKPSCRKLVSFSEFKNCGYKKGSKGAPPSCTEMNYLAGCPLPMHHLRKGSLNQNAYSLFLFMRDVAGGDFVGWLDKRLAAVDSAPASDRPARLRQALLTPLKKKIFCAGDKVLSMALSDLLLGAGAHRPIWTEAGGAMIAVDTLVHNFLHRTGILRDFGAEHSYGAGCYASNGCRAIIERIADEIDARHYSPSFPVNFPRFIQHAIWRFCAASGINRCNGEHINDSARCQQTDCPVYERCDRVVLKPDHTDGKNPAKNQPERSDKFTWHLHDVVFVKPGQTEKEAIREARRRQASKKTSPAKTGPKPRPGTLSHCLTDLLIKGDNIQEIMKEANAEADRLKLKKLTAGQVRAHAKWLSSKGAYTVKKDANGFIQTVPVPRPATG